jgi:hypothetical protein
MNLLVIVIGKDDCIRQNKIGLRPQNSAESLFTALIFQQQNKK